MGLGDLVVGWNGVLVWSCQKVKSYGFKSWFVRFLFFFYIGSISLSESDTEAFMLFLSLLLFCLFTSSLLYNVRD
ncbi:hypothetical protein B0J11DRAFT_541490 [Dendryphion nanum]|uniref:Uncharacterized protein n=1 Tax=Dendryphion nanum TaxID=256645 RepID=A0A9P9D702_9PLEO|nr:hypothetical protein B0J11DRAFT_541490 [Dendryphion nanum]